LDALKDMVHLVTLDLGDNFFACSLEPLAHCTALEKLLLSGNQQLTSSLKPLRKLKHIAKIDLRNTSVRSRERDRKHFGNKLTCKAMPVEHNEDGNER